MSGLSALGLLVRRRDPDRFLASLFAPPEHRDTLFALYAFNHELARAWEVASLPALAVIRLQWWREVVEGAARPHEVAGPLRAELAAGRLAAADLLALIEGRESLENGLFTLGDWQNYLQGTAGRLATIAGSVLGSHAAAERLHALGTAYGVAGHRRSALIWGGEIAAQPPPAVGDALAQWAATLLDRPAPLPRQAIAAGLVGVLARRDLRRGRPRLRGLGDRLAVTVAAIRGRV